MFFFKITDNAIILCSFGISKTDICFLFSAFSRTYMRKSSSIFFHKAGSSLLFLVTLVDVYILSFTSFTLLFSDSVSKAVI